MDAENKFGMTKAEKNVILNLFQDLNHIIHGFRNKFGMTKAKKHLKI